MSSVAAPADTARQASGSLIPDAYAALIIRVLTASAAWAMVGTQLFLPSKKVLGFGLIFYLCVGTIIWAARVRGTRVFARTPIDMAFVVWLALAVLSQLYGSLGLYRVLFMNDLQKYLSIILTTWAVYRAAFALCCVDRRTAVGAFLKAMLVFLAISCVIGIMQGYGPGGTKQWAINFANSYGTSGENVESAIERTSPRPIAMFSGPNIFGFVNLMAMCIIIGKTVAQGRLMTGRTIAWSTAGLLLFLIGTIAAQSRFAIATCVLLVGYFFYFMLRTGRTKVVLGGVVAVGALTVGGLLFFQSIDLAYLESTFERKLTDDASFRARRAGVDSLIELAPDLAILGAGFNSRSYSIDRIGDRWEQTNSIDNGYLQAFITHGVPGLLHLAFYLGACWWALRLSKGYSSMLIRELRVIAGLLFVTYLVYSMSGVRHAKLETSFYWMAVFGLLYAVLYHERWYGQALHVRLAETGVTEPEQQAQAPA